MGSSQKRLVINDLRGGRNGGDPPHAVPEGQCVEALNVDYWGATFAHKRNGATAMGFAFGDATTWDGPVSNCIPVSNLPAVSGSSPSVKPQMFVRGGATAVMGVALATTPYSVYSFTQAALTGQYCVGAEFRGVLYVAGGNAVGRTFAVECVGMPSFGMRKTGLATPAAPTGANSGSGAYAATVRYYKVAYTVQRSGVTHRRSELSPALTFTPSGSGTGVTVTKPASISEGETHWELYVSADNSVYRLLATTAVASTTTVDSTVVGSWTSDLAPVVGDNTVPKAWKYIVTHGNRLLGAGSYTATDPQSRVWFTPVWGTSDVGDAERVPLENYVDLDEQDGDSITGIAGNFMGAVWVFKYGQVWKLIPTGDIDAPFQKLCLTKELGCIEHKTIAVGEDENGNPALYFASHRGPCRITSTGGIQYLGRDVEDLWAGRKIDAAGIAAHSVYYGQKSQWWLWVASGTSDYPNLKLVFDVRLGRATTGGVRGGWTKHTGASANATCSCIWSPDGISYAMSKRMPVVGCSDDEGLMLLCDNPAVVTDNAANVQAYVTTRPYSPGGLGVNCAIGQSHLLAAATSGTTITQSLVRDYGLETRTSTVVLTASASETRVLRQFEGSDMAGAGQVQFTVGDASANAAAWTLDALVVPYTVSEER